MSKELSLSTVMRFSELLSKVQFIYNTVLRVDVLNPGMNLQLNQMWQSKTITYFHATMQQ